jgi:succinate dehydrogenase hydrophobic anchor subunit
VVLDYWLQSVAARRALAIALWLFGSVTFVYGMWALWPWISK